MSKDQALGTLLLVGAIVVIVIYGWMIYAGRVLNVELFGYTLDWWAFSIVASVAVAGVTGVVAWIGYTMATTPPPEPIEFEESSETQEE